LAAFLRRLGSISQSNLAAAVLSFLWPGLGQWYVGNRRRALFYAIPALLVAGLLGVQLFGGLTSFALRLLDPSFSLTLLILVVLVGGWRLLAIADAAGSHRPDAQRRGVAAPFLGVLVAAVLVMHGFAGYYAWSFYQAGSQIFIGSTDGMPTPTPTDQAPWAPSESADLYSAAPFETPATASSRITILLTGIDKNVQRDHSLNDTLLVASIDPTSGDVEMVSFPRDISEFPLYTGGDFHGKINSLMEYAAAHPEVFPDGALPSLAKELGFLLGIPINYFAAVDLDGFQSMIDAIGGVTVDVQRAINDPSYYWLDGSPQGFYLPAGVQHLDARTALAFVRSRYGVGDNDFTRAGRQQQLLLAIRQKLLDPSNIGRLPQVLQAAARTIRTNFPPNRIDDMVSLAQGLSSGSIQRVVLQPPEYTVHPPTNTTGGTYILKIKWDAIRQLSVDWFGSASAFWTDTFSPAGSPIPEPAH
jgi:polyisoprenyl-teichoic acid--peptidoglycan teichoic acid transferase